jgi:hypothetical protein
MKAIRIFSDDPETLIKLSIPFIQLGREFIKENNIPKWFLSEIYGHLKKSGDLPELSKERKLELWSEAGKDKLLYLSLYVIEIL